jgi:hypothetical protein
MLVETQYLSNSKKLVVSYVDKTGDIKLKYFSITMLILQSILFL